VQYPDRNAPVEHPGKTGSTMTGDGNEIGAFGFGSIYDPLHHRAMDDTDPGFYAFFPNWFYPISFHLIQQLETQNPNPPPKRKQLKAVGCQEAFFHPATSFASQVVPFSPR
jgi:hypothetical protein